MKALWTILLGLALVWDPGALAWPRPASEAPASPCTHCNCGGAGCCVEESPASPQPVPAVPVLPAAPGHDLVLGLSARNHLPLPLPRAPAAHVASPIGLHFPDVPLRERHCRFLL